MQGLVSGRSAGALLVHRVQDKVIEKLGGKAAAHVVLILALVFALDTADKGAVGAMAKQLESTFDMSKAQLGTLATASGAVGAIAAIFFGWLVDRSRRTRVLAIAIVLWAGAMAASAGAVSYMYLLYTRLAIGALTAAAVPAVASLVGDYFPPAHRGKMYSYILAGEVIGAAFGLFIAGELALLSWRAGFLSIALPALGVAWLVERLPEPPRDGRGRIREGQERVDAWSSPEEVRESDQEQDRSTQILRSMARERQIEPREELISSEDPKDKSLWWAIGYVLRIPTNLLLIIASALGYYFFAGIRLFGLEYVN
ncbi:MAG TPA: MFS transporter, partial [Terriglobales bacterium]|nr:MFS transporter [Terriglobales bacterium]